MALSLDLRAVGYREGGLWIAHCLELDIVAQGDSPQVAFGQLLELCSAQIEDAMERDDLDSIFHPAPASVWHLYAVATKAESGGLLLRKPIERFEVRAMSA